MKDYTKVSEKNYLDILFNGKNKQYGSYELRKHYSKRASIAIGFMMCLLAIGFTSAMLKPREVADKLPDFKVNDAELANLLPPPKEDLVPPLVPIALPELKVPKAELVFTTPKVVHNQTDIPKENRIQDPNQDENIHKNVGNQNTDGVIDNRQIDNPFEGNNNGNGGQGTAGNGSDLPIDHIATKVDVKAIPPKDWMTQIKRNLRYPEMAKVENISGQVVVSFIVEQNGAITAVKVEGADPGGGLGAEAIRVVKMLTTFTPAMASGNAVRSYHRLPIAFNLRQ